MAVGVQSVEQSFIVILRDLRGFSNHNYLRLTRIMKSLVLLGQLELAERCAMRWWKSTGTIPIGSDRRR